MQLLSSLSWVGLCGEHQKFAALRADPRAVNHPVVYANDAFLHLTGEHRFITSYVKGVQLKTCP